MLASKPQQDFLSTLFIDCGFTRSERTAFLLDLTGRQVHFLDELTMAEASMAIDELRRQREAKWGRSADEDDGESG